ncbi:MAG: hypothetical protein SGJ04_10990, partial [Bacteroidota bacterium]|nr:hypothetical protein [Bacteroidota bacterium]
MFNIFYQRFVILFLVVCCQTSSLQAQETNKVKKIQVKISELVKKKKLEIIDIKIDTLTVAKRLG